jgi:NADH-quinone oxidoreductase subunit N
MLTLADKYFSLAPSAVDWFSVAPEIALGVWAMYLLILDAFKSPAAKARDNFFASATPFFLLVLAVTLKQAYDFPPNASGVYFGGMIEQSRITELMRAFFLLCGFLVCQIGGVVLKKQKLPSTEFDVLVLVGTSGLMLLTQCRNFALLFVALEMLSISMYVLVAYGRESATSLEAGLKYLVQSGLSSALLLMGIVLLYGAAGNPALEASCDDPFSFAQLRAFIAFNPDNLYVIGGAMLVIAGLLFKIAAVPFQIWVSDVYQGAPTPVTAFLGVASKAAGFVLLANVLFEPFSPLKNVILPVLVAVAILTILFGNLAALGQQNVKRLMGLSGISHAGYMLMGVCAAYTVSWAMTAVYLYLFVYLLASFTIFSVMALMSGEDDSDQTIADYAGLMKKDSFLGGILAIALGSLAGIPPMAGFAAKLLLFIAAFKAGLFWLMGFALLGVVISIYYYFGWMRQAVFVPYNPSDEAGSSSTVAPSNAGFWMRTVLTTLAFLTVSLGFWQGFIAM